MLLGRIDLKAYDVIDSNNLEQDLSEKPGPTFSHPALGPADFFPSAQGPAAAMPSPSHCAHTGSPPQSHTTGVGGSSGTGRKRKGVLTIIFSRLLWLVASEAENGMVGWESVFGNHRSRLYRLRSPA